MGDRHLNLFYTYNRDAELIENNLTRAFVVFLSLLSGGTRQAVLSATLGTSRGDGADSAGFTDLDFKHARFALQSNIDRHFTRTCSERLLVTISTEPLDHESVTFAESEADVKASGANDTGISSNSVPDAWIYDEDLEYCVLIEAKVGSYPLDAGQLRAHARDWLRSDLRTLDARNSLRSITWMDVLTTLRHTLHYRRSLDVPEENLLTHMIEFLNYYGYRVFDGVVFGELLDPPDSAILAALGREPTRCGIDLRRLAEPPGFVLTDRFLDPR